MKVLKQIGASFHTRTGSFVFFALAASAFALLNSATFSHRWIAQSYPLGNAFVPTLLWAMAVCTVLLLAYLLLHERVKEQKTLRIVHTVLCVLTGVLFGFAFFIAFALDHGFHYFARGWQHLQPYLFYLGLLWGIPFVFVIHPTLKKKAQVITAIVLSVVLLAVVTVPHIVQAKTSFDFSAHPLVLDIGDGYYSIVFATNRTSVGYLVIDGEVIPNDFAGRMHVGRVHNFQVAREALDGNSYHVRAREIPSLHSSYTEFGATIESPTFSFRGGDSDNLNIALASDWHGQPNLLVQALSHMPQPDLFVMLGDFASGYHSEDEFIQNIIWAGAEVTGSEVPAIFVRGNHEMSGMYAAQLFPGLGLRSFYHQVQMGNFLFTVIDSADDWPIDRINTAEFEQGTIASTTPEHLDRQLAWLEELEAPDEAVLHFSLVHIPNIDQEREETQQQFFAQLQRLGVDMQFSGHRHSQAANFFEPHSGHNHFDIPLPLFFAGGPTAGYSGNIMASMAQVSADGTVHLLGYDSAGRQLQNKTITLR